MNLLRCCLVSMLASSFAAGVLFAGEPYRVLNINQTPAGAGSSSPRDYRTIGDRVLFVADDPGLGTELWVSDGTKVGTRLLMDFCPGPCSSYPNPAWLAEGLLFFEATVAADETPEGLHVEEERFLWRTDGTPEGTIRLARVGLGFRARFGPGEFAGWLGEVPGRVVFVGDDPQHGLEPWVSDGTPQGTRLLADIAPGPASSGILSQLLDIPDRAAVSVGDRVLFVAAADDADYEPWVTDGTPLGTTVLRDILPGAQTSDPFNLGTAGGHAFFSADDGVHGRELWVSDGTRSGTHMVADLTSGSEETSFPSTALGIGGPDRTAFFLAAAGQIQPDLWRTDGTALGTHKLTSFAPNVAFPRLTLSYIDFYWLTWFQLLFAGDEALFWADDGVHGLDLWRTDGTPQGTRLSRDLCEGSCDSRLRTRPVTLSLPLDPDREEILFNAADADHGEELWTTDGTAASIHRVSDICPGECSSFIRDLRAIDGGVLFVAYDGTQETEDHSPYQLWYSSGAEGSTLKLTDLGRDAFELPATQGARLHGGAVGDRFLFTAEHPEFGYELWTTDGSLAGTEFLQNLASHLDEGSYPRDFTVVGDRLFFLASEGKGTFFEPFESLWSTDGTSAGSRSLLAGDENREGLMAAGDRLYFFQGPHGASGLWSVDLRGEDLRKVANIGYSFDTVRAKLDDRLVFTTDEGVWITDGGLSPTVFLGNVGRVIRSSSDPDVGTPRIAHAAGFLFLLAQRDSGDPIELWRLDGTTEGTRLLATAGSPGPSLTGQLAALGDQVLFFAHDDQTGCQLWRADGTPAGTRPIVGVLSNATLGCPFGLIEASGRAFFGSRFEGQLWSTDGTAAGTVPVLDGYSSTGGGYFPVYPAVLGGRLVFGHWDEAHGPELWVSDGTPAGTHLLRDLRAGPFSSSLDSILSVGGYVYFTAYEEDNGRQLWRTDGTTGGTVRLTGALPPSAMLTASTTAALGDLFFFTASDGTGEELWALDTEDGGTPPPSPGGPPPPGGPWLSSSQVPGFRFKVRIAQGAAASIPGAAEPVCIPETLCVSGAVPLRSEVFLRVVGPKPNGKLWPTLIKFTTSEVEVWIEQLSSGEIRYYLLEGAGPGSSKLPGLFDRDGFDP